MRPGTGPLRLPRGRGGRRGRESFRSPGADSFPLGCGRPCGHASDPVHPQTLGLPVTVQRQVPTVHALQLQGAVLGHGLRQVPGSMVQKNRGCSTVAVHRLPSTSLSALQRLPAVPFFWWSIPSCPGRADSLVPPWRRRSRLPQLQFSKTAVIPQLLVHRWSSIFLSWCRGRVPWSCCSEDHKNSPVAPQHGDRCPCCTVRAGQDFFYSPSYLAVTCLMLVLPVGYNTWTFLGDDFQMDAYSTRMHFALVYASVLSPEEYKKLGIFLEGDF